MDQANPGAAQDPHEDDSLYRSPSPEDPGPQPHAPSDAGSVAPSSISGIPSSLVTFRPSIPRLNVQEIAPVSRIDETLDGKSKNWTAWSQSMDLLFSIANARGYIDGRIRCPDANADPVGAENWEFNDSYIRMLIRKNIASTQKMHTRGCPSTQRMWNSLRHIHETTNYLVHTEKIRSIMAVRLAEDADVVEHLTKLKHTWEQCTFSGHLARIYDDVFFKQQIAASLPRSWDAFTGPYVRDYKDQQEADKDPKLRIDSQQFIGIISQEYEYIQSRKRDEVTIPPKGENANTSLANRISNPSSDSKRSQRKKRHCKHCGKDGHYTDQCRYIGKNKCRECGKFGHDADKCPGSDSGQTNDNKRRNNHNGSGSNKRSRNEANNADDAAPSANSALHGQLVGLHAHIEPVDSDDDEYDSHVVSTSSKYNTVRLYDWLGDSGATCHITREQDVFATYEAIPRTTVSGVGNVKTFAVGHGTIYLHSECNGIIHTLQLSNVLHVPNNRHSLLSLGRWEERMRRSVLLMDGKITLRTHDGTPVARGIRLSNRLYQMSFTLAPAPTATELSLAALTSAPSWETWHRRFGHVRYSGLQKLLDKHLVNGLHIDLNTDKPDCVACTEVKMSQAPYGPTKHKLSRPGELTHVDLWGKYDIESIHGNTYYLLLIDDASRYTTVEFLKTKSQAAQRIQDYMTHLKAKGRSPCAIRMDRGTEFVNEELRTWCHSQGIRFQMTAPYSPSQNGVAERMNRTLVELARVMLTDSKLPEFLWEPAVAHAAYVRNLSYTKYTPKATPYQQWNGDKPDVTHLREFGAPVWILAQGQRVLRKMLPKSQCRAYVGYDEGSKAVKYYNAATRNIQLLKKLSQCFAVLGRLTWHKSNKLPNNLKIIHIIV